MSDNHVACTHRKLCGRECRHAEPHAAPGPLDKVQCTMRGICKVVDGGKEIERTVQCVVADRADDASWHEEEDEA